LQRHQHKIALLHLSRNSNSKTLYVTQFSKTLKHILSMSKKNYRNLMDGEVLVIKNTKLEYVTTKTDNYSNDLSYVKIKDKSIIRKLENNSSLQQIKTL
jgi:hypothetical protein